MMKWMRRESAPPIGIDLDGRCLRALQLADSSRALQVEAAMSLPRARCDGPVTTEEIEKLLHLFPKRGFVGNQVVVGVPRSQLLTSIQDLPPRRTGAPVEQIALSELARMNKVNPASLEMVCWELPAPSRANDTTPVMVAAFPKPRAHELLTTFEKNGYTVQALDTRSWAATRVCKDSLTESPVITAILEIGWEDAQLIVIHEGLVTYERHLEGSETRKLVKTLAGKDQVDWTEAQRLLNDVDLDPESNPSCMAAAHFDAIADELQTPFHYMENMYTDVVVQKLLLVGEGAGIRGADKYLAKRLEMNVEAISPIALAECPDELREECGPAAATAMGLGQYEESNTPQCVNLIPASTLTARQKGRRGRWWIAACLTYLAILGAAYLGCWLKWDRGKGPGEDGMKEVVAQIEQANRRMAALRIATSAIAAKIEANRAVGNQPDWSVLLAMVAKSLGQDVVLKHCRLELESSKLALKEASASADPRNDGKKHFLFELSGLGRSQTAVSQFVLRLERAGLFDRVKLIRTSREKFLSGNAVSFQLACSLGAQGRR